MLFKGFLLIVSELGTFEWWISGLMLNTLFWRISRLTEFRDYVSLEVKYLDQQIPRALTFLHLTD